MLNKVKNIKLILFDVDGVFCRGDITYLDNGTELKTFHVQDGMGIRLAKMAGIKTGIITSRISSALEKRARELEIDVISQGARDKYKAYIKIKNELKLNDNEICYLGDDLQDLAILYKAGFSVSVANAREEIKAVSDYTTVNRGGEGAIREVIELILKKQKKFNCIIESFLDNDQNN
jgi:3-deoxy-D-manno-octulosonate 8-phosphate phosphatase (KDO 8-P phosphatase)